MVKGGDFRIVKLEKGPLQRFKNQNLLLKKFGETGLQIYKAITGKRTTEELRKDLGIEPGMFNQVVDFMQDAGLISLESLDKREGTATPPLEAPEEQIEEKLEEEKPAPTLEELPPSEELIEDKDVPPLEEEPREKEEKEAKVEEELAFEEEIKPVELEEEKPPKKKLEERREEEIQPVKEEYETKEEKISFEQDRGYPPEKAEPSGLSPVEKIISDKYGDIGLRVYTLIDGQRTAEEIMRETGLTEAKLVEILDFMDEQGIIKLDYPKGQLPSSGPATGMGMAPPPVEEKKESMGFVPMIEADKALEESGPVPSPLEVPVKAPLDLVKAVQMKAKVMLKYGNKGSKILEQMDGKNDFIDIAIKVDLPLYTINDTIRFMMENGMLIVKPLSRSDVRKKYGDDGYSVYKKYGKEGLMLYELIGKELTIKQMADKITTDKAKIIDMFIFIHKVLGIELPIDKDVLAKQLGL